MGYKKSITIPILKTVITCCDVYNLDDGSPCILLSELYENLSEENVNIS